MLHITNGDCAVTVLSRVFKEAILPWRDVLHEGPVAQAGWAPLATVEQEFAERDRRLQAAAEDEEVVLWFEHDLYDQLQLLQLLDWFAAHPQPRRGPLSALPILSGYAPVR